MKVESNYWKGRRIGRRRLLGRSVLGSLGMLSASLIGCSSDDGDDDTADASTAPSGTNTSHATGTAAAGGAKRGGTVTWAVGPGTLSHLDLRQSTYFNLAELSLLMHRRLVRPNKETTLPEPEFAESVEQVDDVTYVFKLPQGAKFHDRAPVSGREVVADDVVASLEALGGDGPTYLYGAELEKFDRFEAVDDYTVRITSKEPNVTALTSLSLPPMIILPREVIEEFNNDIRTPEANIGLGPFMVESWDADRGGTFVRNPNYYRSGMPYLDGFEQMVIPDAQVQWSRFLSGELTFVSVPPADAPAALAESKYSTKETTPFFTAAVMIPNQTIAPWDDYRAVKALHLMGDKWGASEFAWPSRGVPSVILGLYHDFWWLPLDELSTLPGYRKDGAGREDDVAEANKLIQAMGYSSDRPMTFSFDTIQGTGATGSGMVELQQAELQRLSGGAISPSVNIMDYAAWKEAEAQGQFSVTQATYTSGPDPDNAFTLFTHSEGGRNYGRHSDPTLDEMIVNQRAMFDQDERLEAVREIQRYLTENPGPTSIGSGGNVYAWQPTLQNFTWVAFPMWQLDEAWLDA